MTDGCPKLVREYATFSNVSANVTNAMRRPYADNPRGELCWQITITDPNVHCRRQVPVLACVRHLIVWLGWDGNLDLALHYFMA